MKFYNNDLTAFSCKTLAKGVKYEVRYTTPYRKDYWVAIVDYALVERTFLSPYTHRKDIMALYQYIKAHGEHHGASGRYMSRHI